MELGHVDIITKSSLLSSFLELPRVGHLEAALHIMTYIHMKYISRLAFCPIYLEIDHMQNKDCNLTEYHSDA